MPQRSQLNDDLTIPVIVAVLAIASIFLYMYWRSSIQLVELLIPAFASAVVSFLFGLRRRLLLAAICSLGVFLSLNLAGYLRNPRSYSRTGSQDDDLIYAVIALNIVSCVGSWAIGYALAFLLTGGNQPESGKCAGCGYDLRGNQSGRCSECGMEINLRSQTNSA